MTKTSDDFLTWARDPGRTLEERYGLLRLVEFAIHRYGPRDDKAYLDFDRIRKMREARRFNPAYSPTIDDAKLEITARHLAEIEALDLDEWGDERPIRNLDFLAFMPGLKELKLRGIEIDRLDCLRHLPALHTLTIRSDEVEDYSALATCRELRELIIATAHPWPVLSGIETLPCLEILRWQSDGRALVGVPELPALKFMQLGKMSTNRDLSLCLRDFHQLPEMPLLEHFEGGPLYRLDGIGRYPRLRYLLIQGHFKSLEPLADLPALTHLRLESDRIQSLERLSAMPRLFHLALLSERPQDWTPLMDLEPLREVYHFHDIHSSFDLGTLRMLMPSLDEVFALPEPRALAPMCLRVLGKNDTKQGSDKPFSPRFPDGPGGWDGNAGMQGSEARWGERHFHEALRQGGWLKLQGVRIDMNEVTRFELFSAYSYPKFSRSVGVTILKSEAIGRIRGIFECLRGALALTRYPWQVHITLNVDPDADEWDESWKTTPEKSYAEEMVEVERNLEHKRLRNQIRYNDELRLKLHEELGNDPGEFRPSPLPSDDPDGELDDEDEPEDDDSDEGGIAEYDPETAGQDEKWLEDVAISDPNHFWSGLTCLFTLTEEGVFMRLESRGLKPVAEILGINPEYPPGEEPD